MNSIVKKMIEDLDFVIKHAKTNIEANNANSSEMTATLLEAIRNATFTKASIIQSLDKVKASTLDDLGSDDQSSD